MAVIDTLPRFEGDDEDELEIVPVEKLMNSSRGQEAGRRGVMQQPTDDVIRRVARQVKKAARHGVGSKKNYPLKPRAQAKPKAVRRTAAAPRKRKLVRAPSSGESSVEESPYDSSDSDGPGPYRPSRRRHRSQLTVPPRRERRSRFYPFILTSL